MNIFQTSQNYFIVSEQKWISILTLKLSNPRTPLQLWMSSKKSIALHLRLHMKYNHCFSSHWVYKGINIIMLLFQIKLNCWHWKISKLRLHIKSDIRSIRRKYFNRENCKLKSQTFKMLHLPSNHTLYFLQLLFNFISVGGGKCDKEEI